MSITKQLFANNAKTTLASGLLNSDTTIQVSDTSLFPTPTLGQYFLVTLEAAGILEVVKVRGKTSTSFTNCERGQEGTSPSNFPSGTRAECRVTKGTLESFSRKIDKLDELSGLELLTPPNTSNSNSYLCGSPDDSGNPIVAMKATDTTWRFPSHALPLVSGTVTTATDTSVVASVIADKLNGMLPGKYIIQFVTGVNAGQCRVVTSTTTGQLAWITPLEIVPSVGDSFEIYKSTSALVKDLLAQSLITAVNTFNSRSGAVTLTSSDVTTALGFTPISISSAPVTSVFGRVGNVTLSGGDIITALGFTPISYSAAPVTSVFGRTGSIIMQAADVTGALGYTPVNKAGDSMTGNLTITSGANLIINGSTLPLVALTPTGQAMRYMAAFGTNIGFLNAGGGAIAYVDINTGNWLATGNVSAYSDARLKDNVESIENALEKTLSIRGVTYNRNDIEGNPRQTGVIAQEVLSVLPEVVNTESNGTLSVAYGNMIGLLIEAIRELNEKIEVLESK